MEILVERSIVGILSKTRVTFHCSAHLSELQQSHGQGRNIMPGVSLPHPRRVVAEPGSTKGICFEESKLSNVAFRYASCCLVLKKLFQALPLAGLECSGQARLHLNSTVTSLEWQRTLGSQPRETVSHLDHPEHVSMTKPRSLIRLSKCSSLWRTASPWRSS